MINIGNFYNMLPRISINVVENDVCDIGYNNLLKACYIEELFYYFETQKFTIKYFWDLQSTLTF